MDEKIKQVLAKYSDCTTLNGSKPIFTNVLFDINDKPIGIIGNVHPWVNIIWSVETGQAKNWDPKYNLVKIKRIDNEKQSQKNP